MERPHAELPIPRLFCLQQVTIPYLIQ